MSDLSFTQNFKILTYDWDSYDWESISSNISAQALFQKLSTLHFQRLLSLSWYLFHFQTLQIDGFSDISSGLWKLHYRFPLETSNSTTTIGSALSQPHTIQTSLHLRTTQCQQLKGLSPQQWWRLSPPKHQHSVQIPPWTFFTVTE